MGEYVDDNLLSLISVLIFMLNWKIFDIAILLITGMVFIAGFISLSLADNHALGFAPISNT